MENQTAVDEKNPTNLNQKQTFKEFNEKGERIYNVTKIINHLSQRDGKGFIRDLCNIISEGRRDLLEKCYPLIGKDHFLVLIEKSLHIQNVGGIEKTFPNKSNTASENEKNKSTGGVLFKLIKTESGLNKQNIKEIFKKDYQGRNQRKKIIKKMDKLILK